MKKINKNIRINISQKQKNVCFLKKKACCALGIEKLKYPSFKVIEFKDVFKSIHFCTNKERLGGTYLPFDHFHRSSSTFKLLLIAVLEQTILLTCQQLFYISKKIKNKISHPACMCLVHSSLFQPPNFLRETEKK